MADPIDSPKKQPALFTFDQLAERWGCATTSVYRILRNNGVEVVDFALPGKRGKKLVPVKSIEKLESKKLKRLL